MNLNLIIHLIFILIFGAVTSYDDIKKGVIRNKYVIIAIAYSIIFMLLNYSGNRNVVAWFLINTAGAFFFGIVIWISGLWSGGDAKLFLTYSMLIYPIIGSNSNDFVLVSFDLLLNTFVPVFIYFFILSLVKTTIKQKAEVLKSMMNLRLLLSIALFIFSFAWVMEKMLGFLGIKLNFFVTVTIIFIILFLMERFFSLNLLYFVLGIMIISIILDYKRVLSPSFLTAIFLWVLIFMFLRYFVLNLTYKILSYPVYIEKLKPGMILAESIVMAGKKYRKFASVSISFVQSMLESTSPKSIIGFAGEGLTGNDVRKIISLHNRGLIKEHSTRVYYTSPFSPFMLFGVVLMVVFEFII